jgi:ankyrin repeat protein
LNQGISVNWKDGNGFTLLHYCCYHLVDVKAEIFQFLLAKKADVNATSNQGLSCLQVAASSMGPGQVDRMKMLVEAGANVDHKNQTGQTALHCAVCCNTAESVQFLLDKKADVNATTNQGWSCLQIAAASTGSGQVDKMKMLVEAGANLDHKNERGETALHFAVYCNNAESVQFLLDKKADVNAIATDVGFSCLHAASRRGYIEGIKLLLEAGANVNHQDHRERLALHHAILFSKINVAELLLDYGADLLVQDSDGMAPLDYAASQVIKEHLRKYSPLNSLHKKLNESNRKVEVLRQELNMLKNFVIATSFGNNTIGSNN